MDLGVPGIEDAAEIGRGGFAVVYQARQPAAARTVAVKVLSATVDADWERRFERECQALGQLSAHPNIVTLLGSGITAAGQGYLILEYCPGGSLAAKLQGSGPLPWREATGVAAKLAGALASAHERGVLHRDLKPENVLMTEYGEPALADFGIARLSGGWQTSSQVIVASLAHASPEVLNGQASVPGSDVWSLASTLCQLLAGYPPFARPEDTPSTMIARILSGNAPQLGPSVPHVLWPVVSAALSADPERRPSAKELQRQLEQARAGGGGGVPPPPPAGDATVWTPAVAAGQIPPQQPLVPVAPAVPVPPPPPGVFPPITSGPAPGTGPPGGSAPVPPPAVPPPPGPGPPGSGDGYHRSRRPAVLALVAVVALLVIGAAVFLATRSSSTQASTKTGKSASDSGSSGSRGDSGSSAPSTRPTTTRPTTTRPTTTTTTTPCPGAAGPLLDQSPATNCPPPRSGNRSLDPSADTFCVNDVDPAPANLRSQPTTSSSVLANLPVSMCTIQDASGKPDLSVEPGTGLTWRRVAIAGSTLVGWVADEDLKGAPGTEKPSPADCSYSPLKPGQGYTEVESVSTDRHYVQICRNVFDGSLVYRGSDRGSAVPAYITLPSSPIPGGYAATVREFRYEVTDHLRVFQNGSVIVDEPIVAN